MKDTMIGVDLAKRVFQVHGATMRGEVAARQSGCDERDNQDERAAPVADRREGVARP